MFFGHSSDIMLHVTNHIKKLHNKIILNFAQIGIKGIGFFVRNLKMLVFNNIMHPKQVIQKLGRNDAQYHKTLKFNSF